MKTYALMAAIGLSFLLFTPQLSNAKTSLPEASEPQKESLFFSIIQVFSGYTQTSAAELTIDYSSAHNFSNDVLKSTQVIHFTNAQGQTVSLVLTVRSYSAVNESLQVNYAIGGNDLNGLTLKTAQSIIIEDIVIN